MVWDRQEMIDITAMILRPRKSPEIELRYGAIVLPEVTRIY
jgi:hypothetical protein